MDSNLHDTHLEIAAPGGWKRLLVGPLATIALGGLLSLADQAGIRILNPNLLFALVLVWSAFTGGIGPGLVSAFLAIVYTALSWSVPGHPFAYTPENLERLAIVIGCMPTMALIVGLLKARADAQLRKLAWYLAIEREKNSRLAEALAQGEHPTEGTLAVCAWCHRIRDEEGGWHDLERYVGERYGLVVTHGICPDCRPRFFADGRAPEGKDPR